MLAAPEDPLRLSPLLQASAGEVLEAVRKLGLEGVVGKRIGSIYEPGKRSGAWIKHRTNRDQEFVIGGCIPVSHGFDALARGRLRKQTAHLCGEGEGRVCTEDSGRNLPGSPKAESCPLPVQKPA
jgi:ATP-dependent DNA ligase